MQGLFCVRMCLKDQMITNEVAYPNYSILATVVDVDVTFYMDSSCGSLALHSLRISSCFKCLGRQSRNPPSKLVPTWLS